METFQQDVKFIANKVLRVLRVLQDKPFQKFKISLLANHYK